MLYLVRFIHIIYLIYWILNYLFYTSLGAFTPTCSEKHLPGFIANANAMYAKGVDAIYCISVNDKYVMKAWGLSTLDFTKSGIKLVADGNCELTNAMNIKRDYSDYKLGNIMMLYLYALFNLFVNTFI